MATNHDTLAAQAIHKLVWAFRGSYHDYWSTPSPFDCLRYVFTEAGEALDARLRLDRANDARNRARPVTTDTEVDELADMAIMLASALPPDWDAWDYPEDLTGDQPHYTLENLCFGVARLMLLAKHEMLSNGHPDWRLGAYCLLVDVCHYGRMTMRAFMAQKVQDRLEAILEKHVKPNMGEGHGLH